MILNAFSVLFTYQECRKLVKAGWAISNFWDTNNLPTHLLHPCSLSHNLYHMNQTIKTEKMPSNTSASAAVKIKQSTGLTNKISATPTATITTQCVNSLGNFSQNCMIRAHCSIKPFFPWEFFNISAVIYKLRTNFKVYLALFNFSVEQFRTVDYSD